MTAFPAPAFPPPPRRGNGQNELNTLRSAPYLRVPERLLREYAHDPLTVGVYLAVTRCAMAQQRSVPLSPADLAAWAGAAHERDAGIMRRLRRLVEDGWLIAEAGRAVKARLRPAWGPGVPWNFESAQQGKPSAVRTCRMPLELFDTYLGRLEPKAGRTPALITRYFDRPLLDLCDLGSYALVVAGFALPTERLTQLALAQGSVPCAPQPLSDLLSCAVAGELLLGAAEHGSQVTPSIAGWRRLGYDVLPPNLEGRNGSPNGSPSGSHSASQRITQTSQHELPFEALECDNGVVDAAASDNAWDSRNERKESTNPPPPDSGGMGGGVESPDSSFVLSLPAAAHDLDPALCEGHAILNAARPIRPGEWLELLQLQRDHGAERMLVWQARAARAERDPKRGIVPAYYVACAADEACASVGQDVALAEPRVSVPAAPPAVQRAALQPAPAEASPPVTVQLDPARDELLQAMGVRRRSLLAGVPYELVAAWHEAVQHPGMAARFADPVAFAVSQLAAHVAPPSLAELERWAIWQPHSNRNAPPQLIAPNERPPAAEEAAWLSHAHALLSNGSADDLALLTSLLVQGASDDEALSLLQAQRAYESKGAGEEVCV